MRLVPLDWFIVIISIVVSFIPAILLIAFATFLFTGEMTRAITILIVACPCALVLGAPTAVVAAIGNAARNGILIKGGGFLEQMGRMRTLLLDKTGTLTRKARVSEISLPGTMKSAVLGSHRRSVRNTLWPGRLGKG
jgi:P-type E1-E2 ATPase